MEALSHTEENYLKAIFHLSEADNGVVLTNAIATHLNTAPASVSDMLKKLDRKKVITYQKYHGVSLTEQGRKTAALIIRKHRLWEVFLVDKLGFSWDEVHDIAEQLEHIQSEMLVNRLDAFLDYPTADPHGDPIPDAEGHMVPAPQKLLSECLPGEDVKVSGVKETSPAFLQYLDKLGMSIGSPLKVVFVESFDGSMELRVNNGSLCTVSKEVTQNLLVK